MNAVDRLSLISAHLRDPKEFHERVISEKLVKTGVYDVVHSKNKALIGNVQWQAEAGGGSLKLFRGSLFPNAVRVPLPYHSAIGDEVIYSLVMDLRVALDFDDPRDKLAQMIRKEAVTFYSGPVPASQSVREGAELDKIQSRLIPSSGFPVS